MALQKPRVASCLGGRDEEHRPGIDIIYHNGRMEAVDKTLGTRHGLSWRTAGAKRQLRARGDVVDHLQHPVALIPAPPALPETHDIVWQDPVAGQYPEILRAPGDHAHPDPLPFIPCAP